MTRSFKPISVAIGDLIAHPANVRTRSPETYAPENIAHAVRKRRARRRAVGTRAPIPVEARANARWSLDFVHDQFACRRRFGQSDAHAPHFHAHGPSIVAMTN